MPTIPPNRFIDFNLLTNKPADEAVLAIYDVATNEQLRQEYGTFKQSFLMVDEPRDVSTNIELQSNYKLKFGSLGEFEIYNDSTDTYLVNTKSTGKDIFKLGGLDFVVFDPVNNTIATKGNYLNNTGAAGQGIYFDGSNQPTATTILTLAAGSGIATGTQNISRIGTNNTGLEFSTSSNGTFKQDLTVEGLLTADADFTVLGNVVGAANFSGQINANKTGNYSLHCKGPTKFEGDIQLGNFKLGRSVGALSFSVGERGTFSNGLTVEGAGGMAVNDGNLTVSIGYGDFFSYVRSRGYVTVDDYLTVNNHARARSLQIQDAITAPGAVGGQASIYINAATGNAEVQYKDGVKVPFAVRP